MERISSIFKRPVEVSPEDLGAALFELVSEQVQELLGQSARSPALLGDIDRETFFAEAVALAMFAVRWEVDEGLKDAALRDRVVAAFLKRYDAFRGTFHSRTLAPAEVDERRVAYDEVARAHQNHTLLVGAQFAKHCGRLSPMGATTAGTLHRATSQAVLKVLDKARLVD